MTLCLCSSVRFLDGFDAASLAETLTGRIVLSVGSHLRLDSDIFAGLTMGGKKAAMDGLAELHRRKKQGAESRSLRALL